MSLTLPVQSASLPSQLECIIAAMKWQELVGLLTVTMPDGTKIVIGNPVPAPEDRIWPWFRTNTDGTPDRWYVYALGAWLSRHPDFVGKVIMWEGDIANVATLDGGENTAVSVTTGPFWERVVEMNGRVPLQPGTLQPSGTAVATPGLDVGVDVVTLVGANLPSIVTSSNNVTGFVTQVGGGTGDYTLTVTGSGTVHKTVAWLGADTPHQNMPPARSIWILRRTSRLYYRAP